MTVDNLDLLPAPGRYPFHLTDRLGVVVMTPIEDVVLVGLLLDGELVRMTEEAAGEAERTRTRERSAPRVTRPL